MVITSKLTDEELLKGIYKAAKEFSKLINHQYLIVGKNQKTAYFWFQCHFEKKHFMHLLGIKSKNLTADDFYDRCDKYNNGIGGGIQIEDCTPSRNHSRATINEKVSCCADMLRFANAKYMKVGNKDNISQFVDFTYAYGNMATLGFCVDNISSFPITLIPKCIDEYARIKYKVLFVFEKDIDCKKYGSPFVEIKKGIISEHMKTFPDELKNMFFSTPHK